MDIADRLSEKLLLVESGCWEFVGARTSSGYGNLWQGGYYRGPHVIAYELSKGQIPTGMLVCHTCDNKICCNPDHLFLGTHQDNKDDEVTKDRYAYGERVGTCKLTEEKVLEIRQLIESNEFSLSAIGRMYGVNCVSIWNIKNRITWRHI